MADSILDIKEILDDYSFEVQEGITKAAQKVAKEGANTLKHTSPKKTGDYRKGWRVKTTKGRGFVECIIHNATNYQLTHLLEKPHLKRNGGLTTPKEHIAPVDAKCAADYQKAVENVIKNGG